MRKDFISRELTMELIVGAFMFLILLVMGYFTIILSQTNLFQPDYRFEVVFRDVMGLRKGDNVITHGMTIGKVKDLRLTERGVLVSCSLETPVKLRKDYRVTVSPVSVLGGRMLEIYEGSRDEPPIAEGTLVRGTQPYDLVAEATVVVHEIRQALTEGGVIRNLEEAIVQVKEIAQKLNRGEGTVGRLLADDTLYCDLEQTVAEGRGAIEGLKAAVDKVNRGEGTIGRLMADDTVYTNLAASAAAMKTVSERLAAGRGTMGRLMSDDDALYRDLSEAVASLKGIATRIERGEGALGKLLRDEDLYQDLKGTISETRAAVDDFREAAPVLSFMTILFGAF